MVIDKPRSTSSRPNDAAAMPFPREETTPPVTKMYLVALGVFVIRPALGKRASELPPAEDLPPCRCQEKPGVPEARLRRPCRSTARGVALNAQPARGAPPASSSGAPKRWA